MTPEQIEKRKAKRRERERIRRANRSPEEAEAEKAKARARAKRRYYSSEKYREQVNADHRKWYRAMKANPKKHAASVARQRICQRQWRAQQTPEQRERHRAADRRRARAQWFEREKAKALDAYTKLWPDLTLEQIERRYSLHLLWRAQMCTTCTLGEPKTYCTACLLHAANNKR